MIIMMMINLKTGINVFSAIDNFDYTHNLWRSQEYAVSNSLIKSKKILAGGLKSVRWSWGLFWCSLLDEVGFGVGVVKVRRRARLVLRLVVVLYWTYLHQHTQPNTYTPSLLNPSLTIKKFKISRQPRYIFNVLNNCY